VYISLAKSRALHRKSPSIGIEEIIRDSRNRVFDLRRNSTGDLLFTLSFTTLSMILLTSFREDMNSLHRNLGRISIRVSILFAYASEMDANV